MSYPQRRAASRRKITAQEQRRNSGDNSAGNSGVAADNSPEQPAVFMIDDEKETGGTGPRVVRMMPPIRARLNQYRQARKCTDGDTPRETPSPTICGLDRDTGAP